MLKIYEKVENAICAITSLFQAPGPFLSFYMGHYFIAGLIILTMEILRFRFAIISQEKISNYTSVLSHCISLLLWKFVLQYVLVKMPS